MAKPVLSDPVVVFTSVPECEAWFEEHHHDLDAFYAKIAKGAHRGETIGYQDVLTVALCYGWIDGVKRAFDDKHFVQRFTPRRKASIWSKVNREKAENLIASGQMRPAGLAAVDAARADGRWDAAYEGASVATVPPDLAAALEADPEAKAFFETLSGANRYAILFRVQTARRPETRAKRIATFVDMCHRHETLH